jgi:hypothetical protein
MTSALRVLLFAVLQFSASSSTSASSDCKTGVCFSQVDDATAMLQAKATVSLDGQMSKEDMMLLIKSSGAGHLSGSERLAAAQKMERSMETAVAKMINGPRNYSVPVGFYDEIIDELESMETEIVDEKGNLQTQVNNANGVVLKCNENMNTTLDGSVALAKGAATDAKNTHDTCRGLEVDASTAKNTSCGKLATDTNTISGAAPGCNCGLSTTDASLVIDCLEENKVWVDTHESNLIAQDTDCTTKTGAWSTQASTCDTNQLSYELAVCTYALDSENMCSTLQTCYDDAIEARTSTVESVTTEEKHLKAVLASAKKVVCYVGVLKRSSTENLTMADFESCKEMDVTTDTTYLSNSVPDLDITYTAPVSMQACPTLTHTPGDQQWAVDAYAQLRKDWLEETIVCSYKTTAAPATTTAQ